MAIKKRQSPASKRPSPSKFTKSSVKVKSLPKAEPAPISAPKSRILTAEGWKRKILKEQQTKQSPRKNA